MRTARHCATLFQVSDAQELLPELFANQSHSTYVDQGAGLAENGENGEQPWRHSLITS